MTPGDRGALLLREPLRGKLRESVQEERLADRDADGADERGRIAERKDRAQKAEHRHEHGAETDRLLETERVDGPRCGNGHGKVDEQEEVGQQIDVLRGSTPYADAAIEATGA